MGGAESLEISCRPAPDPAGIVLFAVGGGGDPLRHAPLLDALAARSLTVVALHSPRLAGPRATGEELIPRAQGLRAALAAVGRPELPVTGIGHSIGAATLLALAGARMWPDARGPLPIEREPRLARLVMMAPPTAFFRAPGALREVSLPLLVLAASEDTVTPPAESEFLHRALAGQAPVDLHIVQGAGHFTFMHAMPPDVADTQFDRAAFLDRLANVLADFALTGAVPAAGSFGVQGEG